jgi:hypothetical protein
MNFFSIVLIILPIISFIIAYFVTGRLSSALGISIPILFFSLSTLIFVPALLDAIEEEDIQTLDITEVIDSVKAGQKAITNSTLIIYPQLNQSIDNITIHFDKNAPIPQHFLYNTEEERYELQSTDLYNYTQINLSYNGSIYLMNYSKTFVLNNTIFPDLFPINNTTYINVSIIFIAPTTNFSKDSLFVFSKDVDEIIYDFRISEPEPTIIDELFGEDSFLKDYFWVFIILFTAPVILWIVGGFRSYTPPKYVSSYSSGTTYSNSNNDQTTDSKYLESKYGRIKKKRGDYTLLTMTTPDVALEKAKEYRDKRHWTKIVNYAKKEADFTAKRCCAVYISNWSKEDADEKSHPEWK